MAGPNVPNDHEEEQPLDPAAERVRRKLVRFMGINLGILFAAVMAVVLALVYKSMRAGDEEAAFQPAASAVPSGEMLTGEISIPAGARILSQSGTDNRLTLHLGLQDGSEAILLYDIHQGRVVGRFRITREGQ
jgi:hypothetical protein